MAAFLKSMKKPLLLTLVALTLVPLACRRAEFEPIEIRDSGPKRDALPDVELGDIFCEDPSASTCSPTACAPICHKRTGTIANTGDQCTIYYSATDPVPYDNCKKGDICLSSDNGGSLYFCFTLCNSALPCTNEGACADRAIWSQNVQVKVCDPAAQSCSSASEPCCDPIASTGCDSGRYCYLVAPRSGSQSSWTVCDYSTGEVGRGDPCQTSRDCYSKMACYFGSSSSTAGACRQVCQPLDPDACSGGGTCTQYGTQYGVCL
jgi:hypothetical protein